MFRAKDISDPDDLLEPNGPKDAGYDEWVRQTTARAIARDRAHPERRRSAEQVRGHLEQRLRALADKS